MSSQILTFVHIRGLKFVSSMQAASAGANESNGPGSTTFHFKDWTSVGRFPAVLEIAERF
jgi:hypothetical protein